MILPEEWRAIPGYEGRYECSSLGKVRSIGVGGNGKQGKQISPSFGGRKDRPYPQVNLFKDGKRKSFLVHILVMLAFHGPPIVGQEIDHLDNDSRNPSLSNLEYVTRSEQLRRSYRRDGRKPVDRVGEKNARARLTWSSVHEIRQLVLGGCKQVNVAKQFSIDPSTVAHIVAGRIWRERL